ncbi:hypothetical protein PMAYCL1PPCAC_07956, partial [Pristionchus mayeri]
RRGSRSTSLRYSPSLEISPTPSRSPTRPPSFPPPRLQEMRTRNLSGLARTRCPLHSRRSGLFGF